MIMSRRSCGSDSGGDCFGGNDGGNVGVDGGNVVDGDDDAT